MKISTYLFTILFLSQIMFGQKTVESKKPSQPLICSDCFTTNRQIFVPEIEYPAAAKAVHASGRVQVSVTIDENGNVVEAKAISGHLLLQAAAVKAALQSKFEVSTIGGKPVRGYGVINFNFDLDEPFGVAQNEVSSQLTENTKTISLGVLNEKAKILPLPEFPKADARVSGTVNVLIKIDLQKGEVVSASAVSGHPLLRVTAEKAARQAKFEPVLTEFPTIYGAGVLIYKIKDFTGKVINNKDAERLLPTMPVGGILNGKATKLEKPEFSDEARKACAGGKVEVAVLIYAATGEIISAKAVSGNELLWKSSEEAVMKSKFLPDNVDSNKDYYVKGKIIYEFGQPKCVGTNILNEKVLSVPKPQIKNSIRRKYLQSKSEQTVTVQIVVDETGAVTKAKALTGHPLLRAACEISARMARFAPTSINMPIKVPGILIYKFKPDGTIRDDFPKL